MRRWVSLLFAIGVLATVVAACSSGDPIAKGGSTSSAPTTTTTTAAAAPASASETTTTAAPATTTTAAPTTTTTAPTTTTTAPPPPTTAPPATNNPPPAATPGSAPSTWTVKAGESFWSIASDVTATRLGRPATTAEIDGVWRALIAANRSQLPRPSNPSLLYVGTVLTIPPP